MRSGGLGRQVVVEACDHRELGDGLIVGIDRPQGVRHRSGGVRDDESVTGVGLGFTRVKIGQPPYGQAGQIGNLAARIPGDCQGQSPDGSLLVNNDQHGSVLNPA